MVSTLSDSKTTLESTSRVRKTGLTDCENSEYNSKPLSWRLERIEHTSRMAGDGSKYIGSKRIESSTNTQSIASSQLRLRCNGSVRH